MEEHKKQTAVSLKPCGWYLVCKKDITLEPVQVQEATLAERSVRWELGNTLPGSPGQWSRTRPQPANQWKKSEPEMAPVPGMERHVQWCRNSQKARISWQTTRSDKNWQQLRMRRRLP